MRLVFGVASGVPDCLFFDLFPFPQYGFVASEVDVSGCDVVQALVVALAVVILDKSPDLTFEIAWQEIVFQQDSVLHGLMPAFDFALGLRVERCATDMLHFLTFQPFSQDRPRCSRSHYRLAGVACGARRPGRSQTLSTPVRSCPVTSLSPHVGAKLPGDDVAAVIVQDCAEIIPAPPDDLEVGKIGLPHLVDGRRLVCELISGLDHHIVWRGDQTGFLQKR